MKVQQADLVFHAWQKDLETPFPPLFLIGDKFLILGTMHAVPLQFLGGEAAKLAVNASAIHVETVSNPSDLEPAAYCRQFVPADHAANLQNVAPDSLREIDFQTLTSDERWILQNCHYSIVAGYPSFNSALDYRAGMDFMLYAIARNQNKLYILETLENQWKAIGACAHVIKNARASDAVVTVDDDDDDPDDETLQLLEAIKAWKRDPLNLATFVEFSPEKIIEFTCLPRNLMYFKTICAQMEAVRMLEWPPFLVSCGGYHLLGSYGLLNMCYQTLNSTKNQSSSALTDEKETMIERRASIIKRFDPKTQTFVELRHPGALGIGYPIPVKEIEAIVRMAYGQDEVAFVERVFRTLKI